MTPTPSKENSPPARKRFSLKLWIGVPCALILALVIILSQIDLETVKENFVQRISQETGLKVAMESIGFSFSHGLGLQLKGVKVRSPEGNHFSVERLHLLAEWSPLLKGEFKIKSVTLEHPEATLEIPAPLPKVEEKQKSQPETKLIDPEKIQSAASKVKSTRLSIKKLIVSNGKITLIRAGTAKQVSLSVDGIFVLNRSPGEHLDISASAVKVQTGAIIFAGDGIASNLTEDNAKISLNLKSNSFSWEEMQSVLDFLGNKETLTALAAVNIDQLAIKAEIPVSSLGQIETLQKQMIAQVKLKTSNIVLNMGEKSYPIETLAGEASLEKQVLAHNFSATVLGNDFDIKGKLQLGQKPMLNSRINWHGLDVSQLPLPPTAGWQASKGKLSGTLTLIGPVPGAGEKFPGQLKTSLQFDAENLKLQNANSPALLLNRLEGTGEFANHQVNYNIKGGTFNGTFQSDGTITLSASGSRPPVLNNRVEFANLDLSQLPLPMPATAGNISGHIKLNGPLPDTGDLLTGNLKIDTNFKVTGLNLSTDTLPINIQQLEGKATLDRGRLKHDLNGTVFGGKVKTKGALLFQKIKEETLIIANSDLVLDQVSLDWLPLIHKSAPSAGTVTGNLKIKGPLPTNGKISPALKLNGILNASKLVLGDQQIGKVKLDFKESSSTLTQVQVELERIKLGDRGFKKFVGLLQITPEKIDLTGGQVWPMNGLIKLVGDFKPESKNYRLKFKGDKLKVEEFIPPDLMGPLQFSGAVIGTLPQNTDTPSLADYSRDLSGNIKIKLVDGTLPELGVLKNLLTLLNPTSVLNAGKTGLSYDLLAGDFKIVKGVVHTSNLEMKGPEIMLAAKGQANLVQDTINAQVKAMPLQMLDKALKAIPLLGQILTGGKKGGVIETYFKVHGKLSKPKFTLQPHKTLLEKPGSILKELFKLR